MLSEVLSAFCSLCGLVDILEFSCFCQFVDVLLVDVLIHSNHAGRWFAMGAPVFLNDFYYLIVERSLVSVFLNRYTEESAARQSQYAVWPSLTISLSSSKVTIRFESCVKICILLYINKMGCRMSGEIRKREKDLMWSDTTGGHGNSNKS